MANGLNARVECLTASTTSVTGFAQIWLFMEPGSRFNFQSWTDTAAAIRKLDIALHVGHQRNGSLVVVELAYDQVYQTPDGVRTAAQAICQAAGIRMVAQPTVVNWKR